MKYINGTFQTVKMWCNLAINICKENNYIIANAWKNSDSETKISFLSFISSHVVPKHVWLSFFHGTQINRIELIFSVLYIMLQSLIKHAGLSAKKCTWLRFNSKIIVATSPEGGIIVYLSFLCSTIKDVFPSLTELEGSARWRTEKQRWPYDFTIKVS